MTKLADLLAELDELNKLDAQIVDRVWDKSSVTIDLNGTPLTSDNIEKRVAELAANLVKDFPNENPVLVGLMDGATPFASLLCKELQKLNYKYNYTTMSASSYGHEITSGKLHLGALPKVKLHSRTVVVIDDICDTGGTLKKVREVFLAQHPKAVKLMVLVDKKKNRENTCDPDYSGFHLDPKAFLIGFGLDYRQELRDKTSIKNANPASLPSPEEEKMLKRKEEVTKKIEEIISKESRVANAPAPAEERKPQTEPSILEIRAKEQKAIPLNAPGTNSIFNNNVPPIPAAASGAGIQPGL